jgi:hypothetical protein
MTSGPFDFLPRRRIITLAPGDVAVLVRECDDNPLDPRLSGLLAYRAWLTAFVDESDELPEFLAERPFSIADERAGVPCPFLIVESAVGLIMLIPVTRVADSTVPPKYVAAREALADPKVLWVCPVYIDLQQGGAHCVLEGFVAAADLRGAKQPIIADGDLKPMHVLYDEMKVAQAVPVEDRVQPIGGGFDPRRRNPRAILIATAASLLIGAFLGGWLFSSKAPSSNEMIAWTWGEEVMRGTRKVARGDTIRVAVAIRSPLGTGHLLRVTRDGVTRLANLEKTPGGILEGHGNFLIGSEPGFDFVVVVTANEAIPKLDGETIGDWLDKKELGELHKLALGRDEQGIRTLLEKAVARVAPSGAKTMVEFEVLDHND